MNSRNIRRLLTTALVLGTGLVATVSISHGIRVAHAQHGGDGHGHHGHHGHRGPGGFMHFCRGDMDAKLDRMTTFLDSELELTSDQRQNLDAIAQTMKSHEVQASCPTDDEMSSLTALDKLDRMENRLEQGLTMVQKVRQPFEAFYSSLSSEQQEELNTLMSRRHHR